MLTIKNKKEKGKSMKIRGGNLKFIKIKNIVNEMKEKYPELAKELKVENINFSEIKNLDDFIYERLMVVPEGLEDEADNFINNELLREFDEITENGKTYYQEKTFLNVFE